jgi:ribosomal protein S27AE
VTPTGPAPGPTPVDRRGGGKEGTVSCPSCGHTMAMLFDSRDRTVWHCGRCGTVRSGLLGHVEDVVPKLVERCRQFARELSDDAGLLARWESFGVAESIDSPEDRPRPDPSPFLQLGGTMDFVETLTKLLEAEYGKSPDEARALVKRHTNIVMNGIMAGLTMTHVRAAAMAIEMTESGTPRPN